MRNLFIIGVMVGGAFMAGWFTINREGDRTTIEINRGEIRNDTRNAIDRGREFLDRQQQQNQDDSNNWTEQPYPTEDSYAPQEQIARQPPWQQGSTNPQENRFQYGNEQQQQYWPQQDSRVTEQQEYYPQQQQYPLPGTR